MMADLDPLIRYRKHGVDEKRRVLSGLYAQAEELAKKKEAMEAEIEAETIAAEQALSAESAAYLGRYLEGARKKIRVIELSVRKLETKIMIAQEDMRNAFAEMKKIEMTQENREAQKKSEENRKEVQELDEIALDGYRRRLEEDK